MVIWYVGPQMWPYDNEFRAELNKKFPKTPLLDKGDNFETYRLEFFDVDLTYISRRGLVTVMLDGELEQITRVEDELAFLGTGRKLLTEKATPDNPRIKAAMERGIRAALEQGARDAEAFRRSCKRYKPTGKRYVA